MLTKLKLTALTALSCLLFSPSAQASLENNLEHIPSGADAVLNFSTSKADWNYFLQRKSFANGLRSLAKELSPEIYRELGAVLEQDLAEDLGSHLSVAFWGLGGSEMGFVLVQDLMERDGAERLIQTIKDRAEKDDSRSIYRQNYANVTLYTLENENGSFTLALDNYTLLIGSEGAVMEALDVARGRRAAMKNNSRYQAVQQELHEQKAFAYLNPQSLPNFMYLAAENAATRADLVEMREAGRELEASMAGYDALGFGLDMTPNGFVFKSVSKVNMAGLKGQEHQLMKDFLRLWSVPGKPLREVLRVSPRRPLLFSAFDGLDLMERSMRVYAPQDRESRQFLNQMNQSFTRLTHVSAQEWMAHSNGKGGVAVFYPEMSPRFEAPPHVVLFFGAKNNAAFEQMLFNKFSIDLNALESLMPTPKVASRDPRIKITRKKSPPMPPLRFNPTAVEYYSDLPLYMLEDNQITEQMRQSMALEPAVTRVGNLWIFGSSLEALKASLDFSKGFDSSLLGNRYFNRLKTVHGLEDKANLFFMDTTSLTKALNATLREDPNFMLIKPSLEAVRGIVAGGHYKNNIATGILALDIDMDRVDFELLGELLQRAASQRNPGLQGESGDVLDDQNYQEDYGDYDSDTGNLDEAEMDLDRELAELEG